MYNWIQQVVLENLPLSFVDKEVNRRNSCLIAISSKGLTEAISVVTKKIEEHISKILLKTSQLFSMDGVQETPILLGFLLV